MRPNAHGGIHSRPNASSIQPLSNRNHKYSNHIRASPLEEWWGRFNVGMSNSVTTAIRGSVREMAVGKTKTSEKADYATVEQVPRQPIHQFSVFVQSYIPKTLDDVKHVQRITSGKDTGDMYYQTITGGSCYGSTLTRKGAAAAGRRSCPRTTHCSSWDRKVNQRMKQMKVKIV